MPAAHHRQDFDAMTNKSASSKRSWRFAEAEPRASSSASIASSSRSDASVVPAILAALAPAHEPRRRASPTRTHESGRRPSPTPPRESRESHRRPSHESRRHPSVPRLSPSADASLSPYPSSFPNSPHRNNWSDRDAPSSLHVPAPRSPHYRKASPTWNATLAHSEEHLSAPIPPSPIAHSPRSNHAPPFAPTVTIPKLNTTPHSSTPIPISSSPVPRSPRPNQDAPFVSSPRIPEPEFSGPSRPASPAEDQQREEYITTRRKEQEWSGEWSGAQGMDDVVRSLRRLRVK